GFSPSILPAREVREESEQLMSEVNIELRAETLNANENILQPCLEVIRAVRVGRVRKKERKQQCATSTKRSPCPPKMQCAWMTVTDRFFTGRMLANYGDRKIHFGQTFAFFGNHAVGDFLPQSLVIPPLESGWRLGSVEARVMALRVR